jgi:protein-S-isoprenylcysteine O-methyltransferase Ste14
MFVDPFVAAAVLGLSAAWGSVGLVYWWLILRTPPKTYVARTNNYYHFSDLMIATQLLVMIFGIGRITMPRPVAIGFAGIGILVIALGLWICLWSRFTLGDHWDRHASIKTGHKLIEKDPYSLCRNPIFLGKLLLFVGVALMCPGWITATCAVAAWISFHRRTIREEAILAHHFGSAYVDYSSRTPRFLPALPTFRRETPIQASRFPEITHKPSGAPRQPTP